jgi:hypothetical protein
VTNTEIVNQVRSERFCWKRAALFIRFVDQTLLQLHPKLFHRFAILERCQLCFDFAGEPLELLFGVVLFSDVLTIAPVSADIWHYVSEPTFPTRGRKPVGGDELIAICFDLSKLLDVAGLKFFEETSAKFAFGTAILTLFGVELALRLHPLEQCFRSITAEGKSLRGIVVQYLIVGGLIFFHEMKSNSFVLRDF